MPEITHTLTVPDGGPLGGTCAVYGKDDLNERLAAAKDAGVKVTATKA